MKPTDFWICAEDCNYRVILLYMEHVEYTLCRMSLTIDRQFAVEGSIHSENVFRELLSVAGVLPIIVNHLIATVNYSDEITVAYTHNENQYVFNSRDFYKLIQEIVTTIIGNREFNWERCAKLATSTVLFFGPKR